MVHEEIRENGTKDKNNEIIEDNVDAKEIQNENPEILDGSQMKKKKTVSVQAVMHSGPLPSPDVFAGYESVLPGAADRIIAMAESEMIHRHNLEDKFLESRIRNSYIGIISALIIGVLILISGVVIAVTGHEIVGTIFSGIGITTIIATFLQNTKLTQVEETDKKKDSTE